MTKLQKAKSIYEANKATMTRKLILCEFMEQIEGMSLSYAARCFNMVKDAEGAYKPETKLSKATAIFKELTALNQPRPAIITAFRERVGLTDHGSETYYNLVQKKLAKEVNEEEKGNEDV